MERLEGLLGLVTLLMRVVLIADDLEGFSTDESAALRLAAFLGSLRHSVERLDVILSLNQDIWQSAFLPRLSGGLADRLSEIVVELLNRALWIGVAAEMQVDAAKIVIAEQRRKFHGLAGIDMIGGIAQFGEHRCHIVIVAELFFGHRRDDTAAAIFGWIAEQIVHLRP